MVTSVAVLSDVHGVLPVLDAVLAEPGVAGADLVVITGDHASGPQPVAVLDRLAQLGERAVLVRGNADRELVGIVRGDEVRTIVCGHTHMPFTRLVDRRLVVNPGSIGMPYGRPGGHWALLRNGAVTLNRLDIDIDAAIASVVAGSTFPGRQEWADHFLRATPSDAEALRTFTP